MRSAVAHPTRRSRRLARGALVLCAALAVSAAGPASGQDAVAIPPEPIRAATAQTPSADAAAEPIKAGAGQTGPAQSSSAAAALPEPDAALRALRDLLAGPARDKKLDRADWKALQDFYGADAAKLHWVGDDGAPSPHGNAVLAVLTKADDWGLRTRDYAVAVGPAGRDPAGRAQAELSIASAVLRYARGARGGRVEPVRLSRYFDQSPPVLEPATVLGAITGTQVPGEYLVGLHPRHPQFRLLRQALLKLRAGQAVGKPQAGNPDVKIAPGPVLRPGQSHAHVALVRERLGVPAGEGADLYDGAIEAAVKVFQSASGLAPDGLVGNGTRAALNGEHSGRPAEQREEDRIVLTMERWRWLPADLGDFHVWDNIPEYRTRVIDDGRVVHQAKIIVGKAETQTPLFSADMRYIVFHPDWGVPNSIKVKEILPYLRPTQSFWGYGETDTRVLQRHNLRVSIGGRPVDPARVNWSQVDIRRYDFIQPPGASNVLGTLKFRFPNKHDVYMHDTSQRELFNRGTRTFSHGCVRVENPRRLAEILLGKDKGWGPEKIGSLLAGSQNQSVELTTRIPVHITYATAVAAADGTVTFHPDIYGHDNRLSLALEGRPLPLERGSDTSADLQRQQVRRRAVARPPPGPADFFSALFGN